MDSNPVESINGIATVMSEAAFNKKYPGGKTNRRSKEFSKTFICRRGVNSRNVYYTDEFNWKDIRHGNEEEMEALVQRMELGTKCTKKRVAKKRKRGDADFKNGQALDIDDDDEVGTPRKKQRNSHLSTPRKPRTPSKLLTPSHKRYKNVSRIIIHSVNLKIDTSSRNLLSLHL
jgi:origin recognition complex subunit 1